MYPSQPNSGDSSSGFFWMLVIIVIIGMAVWYLEKDKIVWFIFLVRNAEMEMVMWLADAYNKIAGLLHLPKPDMNHNFDWWQNFIAMHKFDDHDVNWQTVVQLSEDVGAWLRIPVAIILFTLACITFTRNSVAKFVKTYSMKSLAQAEVENWPHITPVLTLDLAKEDINKGPWAMASTPLDFCNKYDLAFPTDSGDGKRIYGIKKAEATRQFILQVGQLWPGVERIPIHLQALVAIFMSRALNKRDMADKLIVQIATSSGSGKLNFTGVKEAIAEFKNEKLLRWLEHRHAYTTTLMASMLQAGRSDGVLATSEFLWLKPVDRKMWYVLNTVGRQTPVAEVAGPFSHWLAEQKLKRAIKTPMIKQAVAALEEIMALVLYKDEGDSWHSKEG